MERNIEINEVKNLKIKRFINRVRNHIFNDLVRVGFFNLMTDEAYLKMQFRRKIHKKLNLDNPQTFNEKLQWLKLNDIKQEYAKLVDKYEVKEYVSNKIGKEYIIPTLGIYNSFEEIDFSKLPETFVIKCTHNSGGVVIVNDKEKINKQRLAKKFNKMLKKNYFYIGRERPYKDIKPRIIIEENIQDKDSKIQINDYKIMCFNGEPKCSFVCTNRNRKERIMC